MWSEAEQAQRQADQRALHMPGVRDEDHLQQAALATQLQHALSTQRQHAGLARDVAPGGEEEPRVAQQLCRSHRLRPP